MWWDLLPRHELQVQVCSLGLSVDLGYERFVHSAPLLVVLAEGRKKSRAEYPLTRKRIPAGGDNFIGGR